MTQHTAEMGVGFSVFSIGATALGASMMIEARAKGDISGLAVLSFPPIAPFSFVLIPGLLIGDGIASIMGITARGEREAAKRHAEFDEALSKRGIRVPHDPPQVTFFRSVYRKVYA